MQWIARELTRRGAPKDHRATTPGWHHSTVRRILTNAKYIGEWQWGKQRNERDALTNKTRQVSAPPKEVSTHTREYLRIVPQELWDAVQARLRQLKAHGYGGRSPIGQAGASYVDAYPKSEFGRIAFCAACKAPFYTAGANGKYIACRGRLNGSCSVHTHAPRALLRAKLISAIKDYAAAAKNFIDAVIAAAQKYVTEANTSLPRQLKACCAQRDRAQRAVTNLYELVKQSDRKLQGLAAQIAEAERRCEEANAELQRLEAQRTDPAAVPTREWLLGQLEALETWTSEDVSELARVFRAFTGGRIEMVEVETPDRKQRHFQARFRGSVLNIIADKVLRATPDVGAPKHKSAQLLEQLRTIPSFWRDIVLDLAEPTRAEVLGDEIRRLRATGLTIAQIRQRLGCGQATVERALRAAT
jgi:DNA-binding transcriptional MerR regulator